MQNAIAFNSPSSHNSLEVSDLTFKSSIGIRTAMKLYENDSLFAAFRRGCGVGLDGLHIGQRWTAHSRGQLKRRAPKTTQISTIHRAPIRRRTPIRNPSRPIRSQGRRSFSSSRSLSGGADDCVRHPMDQFLVGGDECDENPAKRDAVIHHEVIGADTSAAGEGDDFVVFRSVVLLR